MNTSLKARAVAFAASVFVTFGIVQGLALYAYPDDPAVVLASTSR